MPTFTSGYSTSGSGTITNAEWWLKDPQDASRNITIDVTGDTFDTETTEERASYKPLGRRTPIIVADVVRGEEFSLHLEFTTRASLDAFEVLRESQRVLLLQRGFTNDQWYIRLGATRRLSMTSHDPPLWRVTMGADEVDVP
jgi:hypothetical protein